MTRSIGLVAFVALFVGLVSEAQAQKTLRGKVFAPEDHSGQNHAPGSHVGRETFDPLPGATVMWKGSGMGTETDAFGFFQIEVRRNPDTLRVSMVGYETVDVLYNGESFLEVPLEPGVLLESADVVFEERSQSVSLLNPLNIQQLSRKELCKAACCNLSEAFETNASVDASFTDAVTGTRQIHMLGLAGKYTQLLVDNLPGPRGLNVVQGMSFIPGPWIENIFISKGVGTVMSGYESLTGQINVGHRNPDSAEPFFLNLFYGSGGRSEFNHVSKHKMGRRLDMVVMTHGEFRQQENDRNQDLFLDMPLQKDFVVRNEWRFVGDRGLRAEFALSGVDMNRDGGIVGEEGIAASPWAASTEIQRAEVNAKVGYVLPGQEGRSWGSQWSASTHRHWHGFGNRHYEGQQNTFRANVLRIGFLGSENRQFSAGVSYLYDDFLESGRGMRRRRKPMQRTPRGCAPSTCLGPFWRPRGRAIPGHGCGGFARRPAQHLGDHRDASLACTVERNREDVAEIGCWNGVSDAQCLDGGARGLGEQPNLEGERSARARTGLERRAERHEQVQVVAPRCGCRSGWILD